MFRDKIHQDTTAEDTCSKYLNAFVQAADPLREVGDDPNLIMSLQTAKTYLEAIKTGDTECLHVLSALSNGFCLGVLYSTFIKPEDLPFIESENDAMM